MHSCMYVCMHAYNTYNMQSNNRQDQVKKKKEKKGGPG